MPIGGNSFGHFWQLCAELEVAGRDVREGAGRRLEAEVTMVAIMIIVMMTMKQRQSQSQNQRQRQRLWCMLVVDDNQFCMYRMICCNYRKTQNMNL